MNTAKKTTVIAMAAAAAAMFAVAPMSASAGETTGKCFNVNSCKGTGACATTVAAVLAGHVDPDTEVQVNLLGGPLHITVPEDLSNVSMRGPATYVFTGEFPLDL